MITFKLNLASVPIYSVYSDFYEYKWSKNYCVVHDMYMYYIKKLHISSNDEEVFHAKLFDTNSHDKKIGMTIGESNRYNSWDLETNQHQVKYHGLNLVGQKEACGYILLDLDQSKGHYHRVIKNEVFESNTDPDLYYIHIKGEITSMFSNLCNKGNESEVLSSWGVGIHSQDQDSISDVYCHAREKGNVVHVPKIMSSTSEKYYKDPWSTYFED